VIYPTICPTLFRAWDGFSYSH